MKKILVLTLLTIFFCSCTSSHAYRKERAERQRELDSINNSLDTMLPRTDIKSVDMSKVNEIFTKDGSYYVSYDSSLLSADFETYRALQISMEKKLVNTKFVIIDNPNGLGELKIQ